MKCGPDCKCGKHFRSVETRAKIAAAKRGVKKSPHTAEARERMSKAKLGVPTVHGLNHHQSYSRWFSMVGRCDNELNQAYENYGLRGISVCEEWHDLATFLDYLDENLGECPAGYSLDRIDNDGDYEPGNIRWASSSEQARNRRMRANRR